MTKKKVIFLIVGSILLVLLFFEVYFLFALQHQSKITHELSTITPPSPAAATSVGGGNSFGFPLGYFLLPQGRSPQNLPTSYMLLAKLRDVSLQKDQSLIGHIAFAQDNGSGKMVTQAIHISPSIYLVAQNTSTFFPASSHTKRIIAKSPQDALNILKSWQEQSLLFIFNTHDPDPKPISYPTGWDPNCNNLLLLALSSTNSLPKCLPFPQSIYMYAKF